jgi:hypothetical protein
LHGASSPPPDPEEIVPRLYAAIAATLMLTMAACGDEASHDRIRGDAEQMQGQVPDARIADDADVDHVITVVLNEWAVELDRDTIAPGSVRLRVRNNGEHEHALAIQGSGVSQRTDNIPSGQWAVLDLDLQPGTYEVICPLDAPVGQDHVGTRRPRHDRRPHRLGCRAHQRARGPAASAGTAPGAAPLILPASSR